MSQAPNRPRLTLYGRHECHLCDEARAILEGLRSRADFDLEVLDLDHEADAERRARYDVEVPVLELDGRKVMKYRVDAERLLRLLA